VLYRDSETRRRESAARDQGTVAAVVPPLRRQTGAPEDEPRMRIALAGGVGIAYRRDLDVANDDGLVGALGGRTFVRMRDPRHDRLAEFCDRLYTVLAARLPDRAVVHPKSAYGIGPLRVCAPQRAERRFTELHPNPAVRVVEPGRRVLCSRSVPRRIETEPKCVHDVAGTEAVNIPEHFGPATAAEDLAQEKRFMFLVGYQPRCRISQSIVCAVP
jgi:hypothetical protein